MFGLGDVVDVIRGVLKADDPFILLVDDRVDCEGLLIGERDHPITVMFEVIEKTSAVLKTEILMPLA